MRDLHTRLAEVNRKYGLDRGDDIHETGARHRSTAEYNRDLHRENAKLETLISDKSGQLGRLEEQIKKAETRVKGLTTMIANLERQEAELNDGIAQLETDIENGAGDVSELRCRIASLESQLESTGHKLANKRDKLNVVIHFDMDVLDPNEIIAAIGVIPGGMKIAEVIRVINDVAKEKNLVGLTVAEPMPRTAIILKEMLNQLPLLK